MAGGSANGCSAGFSSREQAQLAHLSEGEAKATGEHLLQSLKKPALNLAPEAQQSWRARIDRQLPATMVPHRPQRVAYNHRNSFYVKWLDLGNCKEIANHQVVGVWIFFLLL